MVNRSVKITTYKQAFENVLEMKITDKIYDFLKEMESEGHTERSISFAIWRSRDRIRGYWSEGRFFGILRDEIERWSWKKDDPRWIEHNKRKTELAKAELIRLETECRIKKETERHRIGYIYFVQGESGGAIRIGHSKNPVERLRSLQSGYPDTLKLLLMIPGDDNLKLKIQDKVSTLNLNGEWFKPEKKLIDLMASLMVQSNGEGNRQWKI